MKIVLSFVVLSLLPLVASAGGLGPDRSKVSANAINCYPDADKRNPIIWSDDFPCNGHDLVYLKLDTGNFALWPQKQDGRNFDNFIQTSYGTTKIQKDASGKLKITTDLAGQVGVFEEGGNGIYCLGEESSNNLLDPSVIVDGKLSPEKMRNLALERGVSECKSQGGKLTMEGNSPLILSESNKRFLHVRKIFPSTCLSSSVVLECDISNHANEIVTTYRNFKSQNPDNALSSDPRFDLLK